MRAYLLQTHEMLFDALTQAFRVLGGVPQRGIFDNMKSAVDRIGSGKAWQINARFAAMASHYLFEPEFCSPASGWEKGQSQTHFYLVYGTRHFKGLVEFRKAEKEALRGEEFVRTQARDQAQEDRTGQGHLFNALGVHTGNAPVDPRMEDHDAVGRWVPRAVSQHVIDYEKLATTALERYSVTESEFKDILVSLETRGLIAFKGMGPKQRKPDKGVKIIIPFPA